MGYEAIENIYVVYSIDKSYEGKALYPDDPKVIETLVVGWTEAEKVVYYLRGRDDSRLYGCECWEVFKSADEFIEVMKDMEE